LAHENPFRSERIDALAFRPQGDDWPAIMARARAFDFRCAIVGPHGSGKTTMLEELKRRLETEGLRAPLFRLSRPPEETAARRDIRSMWEALSGRRSFDDTGGRTVVLLDGAEQLGRLAWRLLQWRLRRSAGLIVTTHRPGRLPTLHRTRTSPKLLMDLLAELKDSGMEDRAIARIYEAHGGDLREAFFAFYRACAAGDG
jgi:hypothetical protein